ncbi:MAG: redox-regulated ATPase YchF [Halobacteriales archaeon]
MIVLALAGKPNAGKSTFFKAATLADIEIADYPFTTIEPNRGVAYVRTKCPCEDMDTRCENSHCQEGKRYIPIELIDVAGLVPDAHRGRGLGNKFLDDLMNADAIINIIDFSGETNEEGEKIENPEYDPLNEVVFIREEIDLWLAGVIRRNWGSVERLARGPNFNMEKSIASVLSGLGIKSRDILSCLRKIEYPPMPSGWEDSDYEQLARLLRKMSKPSIVVANKIDVAPGENIERLGDMGEEISVVAAQYELILRKGKGKGIIQYDPGDSTFEVIKELTEEQEVGLDKIENMMKEYGGTGVQNSLNRAVYEMMRMITVFPVENESHWTDGKGNKLPDAYLMSSGSTPRDLAYEVHTDIGEGYLYAVDARSNRRISEDYELKEGDVIKIVSTAK